MRLTIDQAASIREVVAENFGTQAKVWLFGSRADDRRRGGDVDLYIEADPIDLLAELRCRTVLEEILDLHVDLAVRKPGQDHPIYRIAKAEGIQL